MTARKKNKMAIGYIRVSRVGGRGGESFLSPELQREEIARVASREGLEIVEVIEELDASGGGSKRRGWNRAIDMVERGERLGDRRLAAKPLLAQCEGRLVAIERIEAAGGRVCSATEDLSSGLVRTLMLAIAEDERERAQARAQARAC